jgi:hypothetical protein
LTALSTSGLAELDPGDWAQRFVQAWSTWTIFNPLGELNPSGNNYYCVKPPTSICPANTIQQNTLFPINICGNGVQELNEECDE